MTVDFSQEGIMILSVLSLLEVATLFGLAVWFVRRTWRARLSNRNFNRRLAALA